MKDVEIRPSMGIDYPMIDPKTFRSEKSVYERNCEKLNDGLCQVFSYNMWLNTVEKLEFEALLTIICVEFRFLHIINCLKELYDWRKDRLLDMRPDFFLGLLHNVANRMQTLTDFVHQSHRLIRNIMAENDCLAKERDKLVENFRSLTDWLYAITDNGEVRKMANRMFKEQELNYNPSMFMTKGDSFGDHSLAVMNSLVVLSLPINWKKTNADYEAMFDNSYADFLNNDGWQSRKQEWALEIENKCEIYVQNEQGTKKDFYKGIWNRVFRHEDELLMKFGIQHVNATSENGKAIMGRRLFESMNRRKTANSDGPPKMTEADLNEYFLCIAQRQYVAEELGKLPHSSVKEHPTDELPQLKAETLLKNKVDTPNRKTFMRHEADERKLPSIMRDANKQLFDNRHTLVEGSVAWKDYHVAVCLSFYLCDSKNADWSLFAGLSRAFYKSFDKKEFTTMCTYEQFHKTQNKLYNVDFKKIIANNNSSEFNDKKIGHGTLKMWYRFYHRLLPIFNLHLPAHDPALENNGIIKLK